MLDCKLQKAVNDIHSLIDMGVSHEDIEDLHSLVVDVLYEHCFDDNYGTPEFNPLIRGINYGIEQEPFKVWFSPYVGKPIEVYPGFDNIRR